MKNVFNFSAGPAMLPPAVMAQAQQEFINWRDSGCSVMEVSHRGADFIEIAASSKARLDRLFEPGTLTVPSILLTGCNVNCSTLMRDAPRSLS